jgi:hypothetical protein
MNPKGRWASSRWVILLAGLWLLAGCASPLCTKHLFLFRDQEQKLPPASMALLVMDPKLANAVFSTSYPEPGCPWAPDQLTQETEAYRLSLERVDNLPVYQGLCLDTLPTYACEVRPGMRRLLLRFDLYGPEGQDKRKQTEALTLEPGKSYFLRPDCQVLQEKKRFVLKVDQLPGAYDASLRTRVVNWKRQYMKGIDE